MRKTLSFIFLNNTDINIQPVIAGIIIPVKLKNILAINFPKDIQRRIVSLLSNQ